MSVKELLQSLAPQKEMRFAPVQQDEDEISQNIQDDPITHDNMWDLHDALNGDELAAFWDDAVRELEQKEG